MSSKKSTYIMGIDLEGINENLQENGVNVEVDRVIEIGAVIWDWQAKQPVSFLSEIVNEIDHLPISEEVSELTGLTDQMIAQWGLKDSPLKGTLMNLQQMMEYSQFIMAHNGKSYDIPMLEALFKRCDLVMPKKVWIDTYTDIEYPRKMKNLSLAALEHSHGFINPFPHRAVTDVLSMLKVACNYSLERMTTLAQSPIITVVAKLNAPNWKNSSEVSSFNKVKHRVSKARFQWNPNNKVWTKEVQEVLLDEGKLNFNFDWYRQDEI